jgi:hypothetical protein
MSPRINAQIPIANIPSPIAKRMSDQTSPRQDLKHPAFASDLIFQVPDGSWSMKYF